MTLSAFDIIWATAVIFHSTINPAKCTHVEDSSLHCPRTWSCPVRVYWWPKAGCCLSELVIQLNTSIPASSERPISPWGCRLCSKIKQLDFVVACAGREWPGLQRDLCACNHSLGTSLPQSLWNFSAAAISPRCQKSPQEAQRISK